MRYKGLFQNAALLVISLVFALVATETALRLVYPSPLKYYVWPPNLKHTFKPDTTILSGISPHSVFSINRYGVRVGGGNMNREMDILQPKTKKDFRHRYCLCLGGSTTECLYLDDNKTWEAQIAWQAKAKSDTTLRFIGNLGKSGCTSTENYIHLKYCVNQYKKINTVVFMVGINDMLKRLSRDTLFKNDFRLTAQVEDSLVNTIFGLSQGKAWWKRTALMHMVQNVYHGINRQNQDDTAEVYTAWRLNRQHASYYVDTLPDLEPALAIFERNLNLIIDEAKKQGKEVIFINQAALWKDSMSADEQAVLWMGGMGNFQEGGNHRYYTTRALRTGLTLYNRRLAKVCSERSVKLIDIDSQLPRDLSVFYDDCHFNEAGAKAVGKIVYGELKTAF